MKCWTEAHKGGPNYAKVADCCRLFRKGPLAGICISSAGMVDPDMVKFLYAGPQIPNYAGTQFKSAGRNILLP